MNSPKTYKISEKLLQELSDFLATLPFNKVAGFMEALRAEIRNQLDSPVLKEVKNEDD